jgi:hypothetical protein
LLFSFVTTFFCPHSHPVADINPALILPFVYRKAFTVKLKKGCLLVIKQAEAVRYLQATGPVLLQFFFH